MKIHKLLTDVFYPRLCPFCGRAYPLLSYSCSCDTSDITVPQKENKKGVESDDHHLQYVFKAVSPLLYDGRAKEAVLKFKYGSRPGVGKQLAKMMSDCISEHLPVKDIDFVTWVPASRRDLKDKAYHQTRFLAVEVARLLKKNSLDSLQKMYQTDKQHSLNKFRRAANVLGAYEVIDKALVKDKTVLLIDDILTTGFTADECAKMLRVRGCKRVYLCTAAFAGKKEEKTAKKEKAENGKQ